MGRKKKLVNHSDIPDYVIERIARAIYPDILASFQSEEGQQMFAEWKEEQEEKKKERKPKSSDPKSAVSTAGIISCVKANGAERILFAFCPVGLFSFVPPFFFVFEVVLSFKANF